MQYTKEDIISMIMQDKYPLELLYEIYSKSAKERTVDINTFQKAMQMYLQFNKKDVVETLIREFEIIILEDKQGNTLKLL